LHTLVKFIIYSVYTIVCRGEDIQLKKIQYIIDGSNITL
jgi:hypothetical protein